MRTKKIIMLAGETKSTTYMYNGISKNNEILNVVQETPISMKRILKNRAKKLGYFNVFGQILFGVLILPILRKFSKKKLDHNKSKLNISDNPIPEKKIIKVDSVNSETTIDILNKLKPDLIIVNGCRVISKKVLSNVDSLFINTHEGITPRYRGIHGAYWALVNKDKENCGVTVHLVDKGIDTGGILFQEIVTPTKDDNFTTYPIYQTAKGISLMNNAIKDYYDDNLKIIKNNLDSKIWYHPTIWQYLYYWIFRKIN